MNKNIIANYFSQIYTALIGIIILPLYIKYLGAEAYGLISFFTVLQSIFILLDMGLTPTISREAARYNAKAISEQDFKSLYTLLHIIFIAIAIIGGAGLLLASNFFLNDWLKIQQLSVNDVLISLKIMSICIAIRWVTGLYRGVISGFEKFIWLSTFNIIFATLRSIVIILVMALREITIVDFFIYQLVVAILELLILKVKVVKVLSFSKTKHTLTMKPIKKYYKFALTIAFTSSIWILLTQTDKFVLSGILDLQNYGYFNLAVLLASGIMMLSGPIHSTILPRITHLYAQNKSRNVIEVYRQGTQLTTIIVGSVAVTMIVMAKEVLFLWTNDQFIMEQTYRIFQVYAIGNVFLAWSAFPYFLQYAGGNLKYHLRANVVTVIIMVPVIVMIANAYGAMGTGVVWLLLNLVTFLFWIPFLHKKFLPELHLRWLFQDIVKIILPAVLLAIFVAFILPESTHRLINFFYISLVGMCTFFIMLSISDYRRVLFKYARFNY